jgi:hypothetical protein
MLLEQALAFAHLQRKHSGVRSIIQRLGQSCGRLGKTKAYQCVSFVLVFVSEPSGIEHRME